MSENEPPPTYEIATNNVPNTRSNIPPSYSFVALNQHTTVQHNVEHNDAPSFIPVIYDNDPPIQQTRVTRLKRLDYGMRALLVILFIGGVIYTTLLLIKKIFKDLNF